MGSCEVCKHAMPLIEREYICSHPNYGTRGKRIYRETYGVLKKLGCGGCCNVR
jgi:hypothetical protein